MADQFCAECGNKLGFFKMHTTKGVLCNACYQKYKDEKKAEKERQAEELAKLSPEERATKLQEQADESLIFSFNDTDEDLIEGIQKSLLAVKFQEKGSAGTKRSQVSQETQRIG